MEKEKSSDSLCYSEREIDFAYLAGVFNVSGIDGLQKEIERLKGLGKNPHDIIIAAREQ
jgi:antirestriction protein ArdC